MSNAAVPKVYIQIESAEEQQQNLKNQRKTLKVLQETATDKENLTGRSQIDKLLRLKANAESTLACIDNPKRKKLETRVAETQTSPQKHENSKPKVTAEDLTCEGKPSGSYYECLAEQRRQALEETLTENQFLHERIEGLEAELNTSQSMLREAQNLVEILTEMLSEAETIPPVAEEDDGEHEDEAENASSSSSSDNE